MHDLPIINVEEFKNKDLKSLFIVLGTTNGKCGKEIQKCIGIVKDAI